MKRGGERPAPQSEAGRADGRFSGLGLQPALLKTLEALGYEEPTPVQREAIPLLLKGHDLLALAATGTGKTAAFALPLLQKISGQRRDRPPAALVLVPTRELAMQVAEAIHRYGKELHTEVLPIYGGQGIEQQLRSLKRGVDVVVATPGRALDHLRRRTLRLDQLQVVVLDEADEMLDMGFADDLEAILSAASGPRQTALFSATMPRRIEDIARRHLRNPIELRIPREPLPATGKARVRQVAFIVPRPYKISALGRILDMESPSSALVFCRTRTEVDDLRERLSARGYRAEAIHGGMSQPQRARVLDQLRTGRCELLIATDVAARGLDIRHLSHVVNFDVPAAPESYVHRIGRTGRAGREGVAITIAEPREHRLLQNIEQLIKQRIQVSTLPTVAELHAKRLERTRASLDELLRRGQYEQFRVVVESLGQEFDLMDIAAAAIQLAQTATSEQQTQHDEEIPPVALDRPRPDRSRPHSARPRNWRPRWPRS